MPTRPRLTVSFLVGLVALVALASPALAYPGTDGALSASTGTPAPGQTVTLTGSGFGPGSQVTVTITDNSPSSTATATVLGTTTVHATANAGGIVAVSYTVPTDATGTITATFSGTDPSGAPLTLSTELTVTPPSATFGSSLPRTGLAVASLLLVAAGLVVAGWVFTRPERRATR